MSLENGAATITEFTADILSKKILNFDVYVCGGGRKNKFLLESIQKKITGTLRTVDTLGIDGGYIESQAFGPIIACTSPFLISRLKLFKIDLFSISAFKFFIFNI